MSDDWELAASSGSASASGADWWSDLPSEDFDLPSRETTRESLIFIVDFTAPMFASRGSADSASSGDSHISNTVKLLIEFLKKRIISDPDDAIGLILFGTKNLHQSSVPCNGVHEILPLGEPDAESIRAVSRLVTPGVQHEIGIGDSKDLEMYNALWACLNMFSQHQSNQAAARFTHKRIIIFSCHDRPFSDDSARLRAIQKASDLREYDVQIDIMPQNPVGGPPFNAMAFFKDIVAVPDDEPEQRLDQRFKDTYDELRAKLNKKQFKKRALGSIELEIGNAAADGAAAAADSLRLAVKLYVLFKEERRESAVMLDKRTNEKVESVTRQLNTKDGCFITKYEYKKYYPYGGTKVVFSDEEMKEIKEMGDTGIKLMGFKPAAAIKPEWNVKNPYFIYPDESSITGSTVAFHALLQAMSELKQVAICRLIYRRGSVPRFVALFPQQEELDSQNNQTQSPGFHLVFLPYQDDLRNLEFEPTAIADDSLTQKARRIVDHLHLPGKFNSAAIPNPSLQKHFQVIQALALEESAPDEVEDLLKPDKEGMIKFQPFFEDFADEAKLQINQGGDGEDDEGEDGGGGGDKKKRKIGQGGGESKRVKKEASDADFGKYEWPKLVANGEIKRLKIDDLKIFLRHKGLPVSGNKSELLERIEKNIAKDEEE